ncbi:MAG: OmpA family protein, partial [Deltaproteobacteria bacterium]|nr:OmpA family protein [Deltaproteobacteria bacterium]
MTSRSKRAAKNEKLDPSLWMVTFSDLIMLLLTFFVLLLSMSSMDTKRLKEIFMRIHDAVCVLGFSGARGIDNLADFVKQYRQSDISFSFDQRLLRDLFFPTVESDEDIEATLKTLKKLIELSDDERGIVLSFQENILFDPGKVAIKKKGHAALDIIATAIESCPNNVLIMGHTDNTPTRAGNSASNWELSAYRGLAVLEYFLKEKGLPPA